MKICITFKENIEQNQVVEIKLINIGDSIVSKVREIDKNNKCLNDNVIFQHDTFISKHDLILIIEKTPHSNLVRYFEITLSNISEEVNSPQEYVRVTDVIDEERECLKIQTPIGTYYYDKKGGGFTSLVDLDGLDWINYNSQDGARGVYRGIPNLVYPEGFFHPGQQEKPMKTEVLCQGPIRCKFVTESQDGKWCCSWSIYPTFAKLEVLKAPGKYWFLYEGTPGGRISNDCYGMKSDGESFNLFDQWNRPLPSPKWVTFIDNLSKRGLFLWHTNNKSVTDSYWLMEESMTVFGFGRIGIDKQIKTVPDVFILSFIDNCTYERACIFSKVVSYFVKEIYEGKFVRKRRHIENQKHKGL